MESLINLICLLIPVKELRKKIRNNLKLYFMVDNRSVNMAVQKRDWELCKDSVDTVIIGPSYGYYGFLPDEKTFNLNFNSQDLYYSNVLYKQELNNKKYKTIVSIYAYCLSGLVVQRTIEHPIGVYYKLLYGLPYEIENPDFAREEKWAKRYLRKNRKKIENHEPTRGEYQGDIFWPTVDIEKRAKSHLKNYNRPIKQMHYMQEIADMCKANGQKYYVVIAPTGAKYRSYLPDKKDLFKELNDIKGITVLDFYDDESFTVEDFGDCDHLNKKGAKKFTEKIYKEIYD